MSDAPAEQIATTGGFLSVECCGEHVGYVNPRPSSREAAARFEALRTRHVSADDPFGNGWSADPAARELLADPGACAAPDDGERLPLACPRCGASFAWAGSIPQRVSREFM